MVVATMPQPSLPCGKDLHDFKQELVLWGEGGAENSAVSVSQFLNPLCSKHKENQ